MSKENKEITRGKITKKDIRYVIESVIKNTDKYNTECNGIKLLGLNEKSTKLYTIYIDFGVAAFLKKEIKKDILEKVLEHIHTELDYYWKLSVDKKLLSIKHVTGLKVSIYCLNERFTKEIMKGG